MLFLADGGAGGGGLVSHLLTYLRACLFFLATHLSYDHVVSGSIPPGALGDETLAY